MWIAKMRMKGVSDVITTSGIRYEYTVRQMRKSDSSNGISDIEHGMCANNWSRTRLWNDTHDDTDIWIAAAGKKSAKCGIQLDG